MPDESNQQNASASATQSLPPIVNNATTGGAAETIQDNSQATKTGEKKKTVKKKYKPAKLIFNLMYTVYPIIKKVSK